MAYNVSVVYDVFAVAIKKREAFQQPQKCAGMSRGRRSRPRRMEAKPRRGAAYTILLCEMRAKICWRITEKILTKEKEYDRI